MVPAVIEGFFASHAIEEYKRSGVTFKAPSIALPGNFIYFICDVPHLIKTTRNAWSNSTAKGTRNLEVNSLIINNIIEIICFEIGRLMAKRLSGHTLLDWLKNHGPTQPCALEKS